MNICCFSELIYANPNLLLWGFYETSRTGAFSHCHFTQFVKFDIYSTYNSTMSASWGFFFNRFFQGSIHSVIFKLFWCDNTEDNVNVFWYHTSLFCHVSGHIWGGNQRERCQAEFSRTRLAAKLVLTCDSSELQPGKACCYHSHCITWTVTVQTATWRREARKSPASGQFSKSLSLFQHSCVTAAINC